MEFNKNQLEAINTVNGNLVITAVAGSGKTTVLTHRILNMIDNYNINPQNILAITFSKKAKENMIDKLNKLTPLANRINIETFHSLALKIIQSEYGNQFKVWTTQWEKEACIGDICSKLGLCSKEDAPYNEIMIFIAKQKTNMIKPDDELIYMTGLPFKNGDMKDIYNQYEHYKTQNNLIEFDDFLNVACDIFNNNKELLKSYQNKFKYILSDEFQDVSKNQNLLIEYLGKCNNNTFIVGDILQSIYSFRGGRSENMSNFDVNWNCVKVINLNTNYRCSSNIVDTANEFAKCIPESKHRNYAVTIADKPYFKKPTFTEFEDSYLEGRSIANRINELCKTNDYTYKDFAILARTNAQLQKLETTLHNNNISFGIVDGKLFTEQTEIQLLLSYLKLSINTADNNAFRYLYNKPLRWLSKKFLQEVESKTNSRNKSLYDAMFMIDRRNWRFKNGINEIHNIINKLQNKRFKNVGEMVKYLRNTLQIDEFVSKGNIGDDGMSEQSENMDSFQDICKQYQTIHELLEYLDELNNQMNNTGDDKVKLMTIHKSKGLEFPVVFIIGCSDGILPHFKSNDVNDEKRLMYVGITRAEKELYLSSAKLYNDRILGVSPFIDSMGRTIEIVKEEENIK